MGLQLSHFWYGYPLYHSRDRINIVNQDFIVGPLDQYDNIIIFN